MSDLKDIRKKINEIDEQMAKLFEERMKASSEVANYKKEHALPIFDSSREQELINKNLEYIVDEDAHSYVHFLWKPRFALIFHNLFHRLVYQSDF